MRVFVTGGTGNSGSYIISDLVQAGHEVTGLARTEASAAALSALGAKVRRGDLEDLAGLKEAAAASDGVLHVAHRQDLLPAGGMSAVAAAEVAIMQAYGDALAGTGKPLVAAGSIGSPGSALGRPATEEDPALPAGAEHRGTLRARNVVETVVIGLADRGVRSSVVRIPPIVHGPANGGFLLPMIGLAKEKGAAGYAGDGANRWGAVDVRDVASLFRLALEKGPAGKWWHAIGDEGIPLRQLAEVIARRLGIPAVSVPLDDLMLPGYFGFMTAVIKLDLPATSLVTRRVLGWEPRHAGLLDDLEKGDHFSARTKEGI